MKKNIIIFTALIFVILGGAVFYWYDYRVSEITKSCSFESIEKAKELHGGDRYLPEQRDKYFEYCLQEHGIR